MERPSCSGANIVRCCQEVRCCCDQRRQRHRTAAIAINNAAITMLRYGHYRDATESFKVAVKIMKLATTTTDEDGSSLLLSDEEIHQAMDRSYKLTSRCSMPNGVGATKTPTLVDETRLHVISNQLNPSGILGMLTSTMSEDHNSSIGISFPMTIDPIDFENRTIVTQDEVFLDASVVMYNFGIAMQCMATTMTTTQNSASPGTMVPPPLMAKADHIFQMTHALLDKLESDNIYRIPTCFSSRLLLLKTVVLHKLLTTTTTTSSSTTILDDSSSGKKEEYHIAIQGCLHYIHIHQTTLPMNESMVAPSA